MKGVKGRKADLYIIRRKVFPRLAHDDRMFCLGWNGLGRIVSIKRSVFFPVFKYVDTRERHVRIPTHLKCLLIILECVLLVVVMIQD